jgi:glycosyltransferase involved in cell wall biosynthesis
MNKIKPNISIVVPTMRPGGLDVLFEGLSRQTFKNFEVILADGIYKYRKDIVAARKKNYDFVIKHVEPTKNTFPVASFCNTSNTGVMHASANLILFLTDYTYLPINCVENHVKFHTNNPQINIGYMCPHQYRSLPELHEDFPIYDRQDAELYEQHLKDKKLENVLWSIFKKDFCQDPETLPLDAMGNADTKLFMPYGPADHHAFNGKNESLKTEAFLKVNGYDEDLDGTHCWQDNILADTLLKKLNFTWIVDASNKGYIINPRYVMPFSKWLRPYETNRDVWERKKAANYIPIANNWDIRKERSKMIEISQNNTIVDVGSINLEEFNKNLKVPGVNIYKVLTGEAKLELDVNAFNISPLKLNLASGTDIKDGWLNLDAVSQWPGTTRGCDIVWDARKNKIPFADNTVDEVRTGELFLHIPKIYHDLVLADIFRVLKPGAYFTVNDINMEWAMTEWLKNPSDRGLAMIIWGCQHDDWVDYDRHCNGFTAKSLAEMLELGGFINLERINIHNTEATKYELTYKCQKP